MSVNKVILLGHVGKEPELRHTESGYSVTAFTLATTEKVYKKPDGSQYPDITEWHNIITWRGLADIASKYVKKGTSIYFTYIPQSFSHKQLVFTTWEFRIIKLS